MSSFHGTKSTQPSSSEPGRTSILSKIYEIGQRYHKDGYFSQVDMNSSLPTLTGKYQDLSFNNSMVQLKGNLSGGGSGARSAMSVQNSAIKSRAANRHSSMAERTPQPKGPGLSKSNSMNLEAVDIRMHDAAIRSILTQQHNQFFDKQMHEGTLRNKVLKWGYSKAKVESQLFERNERVRDTSFF